MNIIVYSRFCTDRSAQTDCAGRDEVEWGVHVFPVLPHVQHQALCRGRRQARSLGHVGEHICHGTVHGTVREAGTTQFLSLGVSVGGGQTLVQLQ